MAQLSRIFLEYGLAAVFAGVFLDQVGLPIPALPILLLAGAGAVAMQQPAYAFYALGLAIVASILGDALWFWAGRRYGHSVLKLLCRVSLSQDSCVRQTESAFERGGARTLLIAKFVPGLSVVAPPVAGALGYRTRSFLLYDGAGALLWAASGLALGALFHAQIDWLFERLAVLGGSALALAGVALGSYLGVRAWKRQRSLRALHAARIPVAELSERIGRGEPLVVLDVRSRIHRELDGWRIPGARGLDLDELERALPELPRDRDLIVYCACPNDATAVHIALLLHQRGLVRVRPLSGGIDAWRAAGLELERLAVVSVA